MYGLLRALWMYRGFVLSSIQNEFKARFVRSKLGGLWMVIHPLTQVAIYALVLSNVLAAKLPGINNKYGYALYLTAGILGWNLFSEIISRCLTLFIDSGNLMKKMRFPRITLPAIVLGSCLLNYLLLLGAVLGVFALFGHVPGWRVLWLVPVTLLTAALAIGLGLILGVVNVFVRDVGQVVPIIIQVLFWMTPIVYPVHTLPEGLQGLIQINPMYALVSAYHDVLVFDKPIILTTLLPALIAAVGLLLAGLFIFRRATPEMVDVL